ncbi:MAG: putative porin [Candidatus Omnitrophica bacterium]|nr:putative porin [Candidatus Omnitrophota bacterium]
MRLRTILIPFVLLTILLAVHPVLADSESDHAVLSNGELSQQVRMLQKQLQDMQQVIHKQNEVIEKLSKSSMDANQINGDIASNEKSSQEATFKNMLPDWLNSMKLSGDFRLRDQYQRRKVPGGSSNFAQNRGRFRARLNFEDQINNKVKVVFGIATDGGKPDSSISGRSSNITFGGNNSTGDGFAKAGIAVNKAYAVYTPNDMITMIGGKMDQPLWEPANLYWKEPDITPEGGAIQLQKKFSEMLTPFSTNAFFVLHDATPTSSLKTDPYLFASQNGIKGNLTEKVYYKLAGTYYEINNPSHLIFTNTSISGSTSDSIGSSSTKYRYNFHSIEGSMELGLNDPFGELLPSGLYIPQVGIFGAYGTNTNPSQNNAVWQMGGYIGNSSINGWGTWRLTSFYRVIERDAWIDTLTDDDFYGGYTDTAGWRTQLSIGLAKNVWLDLIYYRTHIYKTFTDLTVLSQRAPEDLAQADVSFKF